MSGAIILAAAENERERRVLRLNRRMLRVISAPLLTSEKEFIGHYRLRKSEFEDLCREVTPFLPVTKRTSALRPEIKILAALAYYANGCYQKNVGAYYHLGLGQASVSECLRDVTEALNHPSIQQKFIRFPRSRLEREAISKRFMEKYSFPGVVGCLDGSHVAIIRPSACEECYFNRKMYHSLNVLIICDADLRVLYVDASFGGQSHDSHVWNCCPVKALMLDLHEQGEVCWLLGDSGYAQRPWLMTPILNAETNSPEEHYTNMHVRTRNVVERCIGVLKTRWRCLLAHRVMHYTPVKAGKMVNACVVLHNFIKNSHIIVDEAEMSQDRSLQLVSTLHEPTTVNQPSIDRGRQAVVDRLWRSQRHNI